MIKNRPAKIRDTIGKTKPNLSDQTEFEITKQIMDYLKWSDIFCWRDRQVNKKSTKGVLPEQRGVSDILGMYKGKFLAIEVKKPGGKPSEEQVEFIRRVNEGGGHAFIAYSVDDVIEELKRV